MLGKAEVGNVASPLHIWDFLPAWTLEKMITAADIYWDFTTRQVMCLEPSTFYLTENSKWVWKVGTIIVPILQMTISKVEWLLPVHTAWFWTRVVFLPAKLPSTTVRGLMSGLPLRLQDSWGICETLQLFWSESLLLEDCSGLESGVSGYALPDAAIPGRLTL